jgi:hypothetical protein
MDMNDVVMLLLCWKFFDFCSNTQTGENDYVENLSTPIATHGHNYVVSRRYMDFLFLTSIYKSMERCMGFLNKYFHSKLQLCILNFVLL